MRRIVPQARSVTWVLVFEVNAKTMRTAHRAFNVWVPSVKPLIVKPTRIVHFLRGVKTNCACLWNVVQVFYAQMVLGAMTTAAYPHLIASTPMTVVRVRSVGMAAAFRILIVERTVIVTVT